MCGIFACLGTTTPWELLNQGFAALQPRGPDASCLKGLPGGGAIGFQRLSILDLSSVGMQPFTHPQVGDLVCNGEIYNHKALRNELLESGIESPCLKSTSDCAVLLPLIQTLGFREAVARLDGEFALVVWDAKSHALWAARDPLGIRPLFWGRTAQDGQMAFASEAKALLPFCTQIAPFPPGHLYHQGQWSPYAQPARVPSHPACEGEARWTQQLAMLLERAVVKRLESHRPLGCLLSGGLDSSLVAALAQKNLPCRIKTYAIGIDKDPIDLKYARQVAAYIDSDHTEVTFTLAEALALLPTLIAELETWDVTTVRASIGMKILARAIGRHSDTKVLLTGEVSDELFGYKYTDFAPNPEAFQWEARKRIEEIHFYDVLRADRCLASCGLEARVPFGDPDFVRYVMAIPAAHKQNTTGVGKRLLREAFSNKNLLPHNILMREKAAFSDAVGHSMVDGLKAYAHEAITDSEFCRAPVLFPHCPPRTKEAFLYRKLFEESFPGRAEWIPAPWMPNPTWVGEEVTDPSARVLQNYGKSGE